MRRLAISLCVWTATAFTLTSTGKLAYAGDPQPAASPPAEPEKPAESPPAEAPASSPPSDTTAAEISSAKTLTEDVQVKTRWDDIAVLPRRFMLKSKRVEISPTFSFNFNNPLIRHNAIGGQINYYLSEALWVGVEGQGYLAQQYNGSNGAYFLTGAQDKVLPAVNKLVFSALLDFGYVPAHGKFALFNRSVIHWEGYVTLGVGAFMSEVIPVKRSDPAFRNISAIVKIGVGSRMFLTRWLALNSFLSLYGYPDTFEPVANVSYDRSTGGACKDFYTGLSSGTPEFESAYANCRKTNGNTALSLDVVFGIGLSFFLPPRFEYKLAR
jgi:hypothetical protein